MKGAWRRGLFRISPGGTLRVTLAMPLCLDLVGGSSFRFFESDKILRCNETSFRYIHSMPCWWKSDNKVQHETRGEDDPLLDGN
jgi:hypothetical protein